MNIANKRRTSAIASSARARARFNEALTRSASTVDVMTPPLSDARPKGSARAASGLIFGAIIDTGNPVFVS